MGIEPCGRIRQSTCAIVKEFDGGHDPYGTFTNDQTVRKVQAECSESSSPLAASATDTTSGNVPHGRKKSLGCENDTYGPCRCSRVSAYQHLQNTAYTLRPYEDNMEIRYVSCSHPRYPLQWQ